MTLYEALVDMMKDWPEDRKEFLKCAYDVLKDRDPIAAKVWRKVCKEAKEMGLRTDRGHDWATLQGWLLSEIRDAKVARRTDSTGR